VILDDLLCISMPTTVPIPTTRAHSPNLCRCEDLNFTLCLDVGLGTALLAQVTQVCLLCIALQMEELTRTCPGSSSPPPLTFPHRPSPGKPSFSASSSGSSPSRTLPWTIIGIGGTLLRLNRPAGNSLHVWNHLSRATSGVFQSISIVFNVTKPPCEDMYIQVISFVLVVARDAAASVRLAARA
jgi:hypothetical protein